MAHLVLNRICPIVLVTGCQRETQSLQISCFLLSLPSSICAQALPVLATWLQSQHECGVPCQIMTHCLWGKRRKCSHPSRLREWSSLTLLVLFEMFGGKKKNKVGWVSGEGRGIAKKKKASCTQKGMGPSKAKKCHSNCASERRKWYSFLIYGYALGSLGNPRFIASCDESLCAYKARTLRGPRFFMNCISSCVPALCHCWAIPMYSVLGTLDSSGVGNGSYNSQSPCPFLLYYIIGSWGGGVFPSDPSMLVGFCYRDVSEVSNVLFWRGLLMALWLKQIALLLYCFRLVFY